MGQNKQHKAYGTIISKEGPLPFATLGIAGKPIGTIGDELGRFAISIPNSALTDTLTVSYIGFQKQLIPVRTIIDQPDIVIQLEEAVLDVSGVEVNAKRRRGRIKVIGSRKLKDSFFWVNDGGIGSEIARLMTPKQDFALEYVSTQIHNPQGLNFTLLVNIYQQDEHTGLPSQQLLKEIKVVQSDQRKGWLEVDLRNQNLLINEPFFVSFQWVNIEQLVPMIGGDTSPGKSYMRHSPLDSWKQLVEWNMNAKGLVLKKR